MLEKSENFNSLRPILFELCKKTTGVGQIDPPPAGIGLNTKLSKTFRIHPTPWNLLHYPWSYFSKLVATPSPRKLL